MRRTLFISALILAIVVILSFIWMGALFIPRFKPTASSATSNNNKPLILVSVAPYAEMVHQIGGDTVDVRCVVPANADPHGWEPTYSEMNALRKARVWLTTGLGFEPSLLEKLREINPEMTIFPLYDKVERLPAVGCQHKESFDTHLWLSPKLCMAQARLIESVLIGLEQEHAALYRRRTLALEGKLRNLDNELEKKLTPFQGKLVVTSHGAYTYFCHAYGLQQLVIEPACGKEPRMKEVAQLANRLRQERDQIVAILAQPQHTNKAANILGRDLGLRVHLIDPNQSDYIATMEKIADIIEKSREKQPD